MSRRTTQWFYLCQLKKGLQLEHAVISVLQILMETKKKQNLVFLGKFHQCYWFYYYFFLFPLFPPPTHIAAAFLLCAILYGLTSSWSSTVPHYVVVLREPLRLFSSSAFGVIRVLAASLVLHAARHLDLELHRETLLFRSPSFWDAAILLLLI